MQLQLLLYLKAAKEGVGGSKPAGAFYFTVNDPMVESAEDVKSAAEAAIAKEMQLKGVVLADTEVVQAMDADVPGYSIGQVFNKDGSVAKTAAALDLKDMQALLRHAQQTAADLADRIRQGHMEVSPAQIDNWSACDYCEYQAVCGLDPKLPGCESRLLEDMTREELMARLQQET